MGFLELTAMAVLPYFIISKAGRKYSSVFALICFVVVGVLTTLAIALLYVTQTFEAGHPLKEVAIRQTIGMGFWFALFGSTIGALNARKWATKDASMTDQSIADAANTKWFDLKMSMSVLIGVPIIAMIALFLIHTFFFDEKEKQPSNLPEALVIPKSPNSGSLLQDRVLKNLQKN